MSTLPADSVNLFLQGDQDDMARRRGQRIGYVYRRGDSWFGQYRIDTTELDEQGKFKRKKLTPYIAPAAGPGKVSKRRAMKEFYDTHLKDLHKSGPLSTKTVAEFVRERFEPDVVWTCKPSGKRHYKHMLEKHVVPALGDFMLRDIRTQHIQALVRAKLESGLSRKTASHISTTIGTIFAHAKRLQAYSGDLPTDGVRLPAPDETEKRPLTWAQVQTVAAWIGRTELKPLRKGGKRHRTAEDMEDWNRRLSALVIILAVTGMRIGEVIGLRWKRVNLSPNPVMVDGEFLAGCAVSVRENYVHRAYGTVKSKKSRRSIPLPSEVLAAFGKLTPGLPDEPVFISERGTPLDEHNIAARFLKPAGKKAGCPWVSWHVLRHTAATLADQAGLSVSERQRVLGHAAEGMTLHYTHADMETVRGKMEQIGKGIVQ